MFIVCMFPISEQLGKKVKLTGTQLIVSLRAGWCRAVLSIAAGKSTLWSQERAFEGWRSDGRLYRSSILPWVLLHMSDYEGRK